MVIAEAFDILSFKFRSRIGKIPLTALNFIITKKCNSRCVYCSIWKKKEP